MSYISRQVIKHLASGMVLIFGGYIVLLMTLIPLSGLTIIIRDVDFGMGVMGIADFLLPFAAVYFLYCWHKLAPIIKCKELSVRQGVVLVCLPIMLIGICSLLKATNGLAGFFTEALEYSAEYVLLPFGVRMLEGFNVGIGIILYIAVGSIMFYTGYAQKQIDHIFKCLYLMAIPAGFYECLIQVSYDGPLLLSCKIGWVLIFCLNCYRFVKK